MRMRDRICEVASIAVLVGTLAACGNSTPLPSPASSAEGAAPAAGAYTPSAGAFAEVPASALQGATATNSCNLDAVNGQPVGSAPLARASTAQFAGWAADAEDKAVPARVRLVLRGAHTDYAVDVATDMARPDVAKANDLPALATSGYAVNATLSAVAPGTYTPVVAFNIGGKHLVCVTQAKLTVD